MPGQGRRHVYGEGDGALMTASTGLSSSGLGFAGQSSLCVRHCHAQIGVPLHGESILRVGRLVTSSLPSRSRPVSSVRSESYAPMLPVLYLVSPHTRFVCFHAILFSYDLTFGWNRILSLFYIWHSNTGITSAPNPLHQNGAKCVSRRLYSVP